jgi:hypothetical protein
LLFIKTSDGAFAYQLNIACQKPIAILSVLLGCQNDYKR